jgi:transcriptional regulator with GAF, ATPase, and Fis domain
MVTVLSAPICFGGRPQALLNFFSRQPGWFRKDDLPIAERVANHIALAMSHHRLSEEARRAAEANARAERLESRVQQLTEELDALGGHRRVIGESRQSREVLKKSTQVAGTEATVLLLGESGTGKEVIARFIHRGSARRDRPFIALNCAALPEHLLEAELFGFEAGAFTGAMKAKPGQIEQAAGSVLFLDEITYTSYTSSFLNSPIDEG